MRVALLCSGLGHIVRGHEIFARDLFAMLRDTVDITLFKGGGEPRPGELVIAGLRRTDTCLRQIRVTASPKWASAVQEQEQLRIEHETFAFAALKPLLEGEFDIVHCLEKEVCNVIFANRHLFARTPKIVFSNGGAIPARNLPRCDFVQEHTPHNLKFSAKGKAFLIPHGVDVEAFRPGLSSDFRTRHSIPTDAFVVISVGTVCYHHKRMDYVIREVAALEDVYLVIVGQESEDTPAITALGRNLMGERVIFDCLPHDELPQAYAAADVFVLGSLFETFGIVYIEAMAMGLPVICTNHVNQQSIVRKGIFIDMSRPGVLTAALRDTPRTVLAGLGLSGREIAEQAYDLRLLKQRYLDAYSEVAASATAMPGYGWKNRVGAHVRNAARRGIGWLHGRAQ